MGGYGKKVSRRKFPAVNGEKNTVRCNVKRVAKVAAFQKNDEQE